MNIDMTGLINSRIDLEGNCPGLYFLYDTDDLVYIGKGWNCLLRVAEHTRKDSDKVFTSWSFIRVDDADECTALEKELIRKYLPKYNKTHKGK